jgi:predicted nuclease of restriction endonuclease-like (RecB) superfamily
MKTPMQKPSFNEIIVLIEDSKQKAFSQVNSTLIELYWNIGQYISKKTIQEKWGKSIVQELAIFIKQKEPMIQGFSDKNLWRMKQFFETYKENTKLSPLVREITWTNNLLILSASKSEEVRAFPSFPTSSLETQIDESVSNASMHSRKQRACERERLFV